MTRVLRDGQHHRRRRQEPTGPGHVHRSAGHHGLLTQTCIPVPGTTEQVILVSGASPVLDLAEAFHDIFDAVTGTFRFV